VVAERTPEGVDLYPVRAGAVIEQGLVQAASPGALEPALARIDWSAPPTARDDRPWLVSFFSAAKARAVYAIVSEDLAARLRELLAERV
jgi:hypothetical protein